MDGATGLSIYSGTLALKGRMLMIWTLTSVVRLLVQLGGRFASLGTLLK